MGRFFRVRPYVPCVNLRMFSRYFSLVDAGTLLRDIFMSPAKRDTLTGHFFASLCPLRQFANCFAMSANFS